MNNAFSMIYAKQGNPALRDLIELRSTAALPIAGRYRMIDIQLSNLTNSGIHTVGIITQRNYNSLMDHLGSGKEWDMSKKVGGLHILPPYDLATGSELNRGFVDALLNKRDFIDRQRQPYVLLMSTEFVYRQDFNAMMQRHMDTGADITVLYTKDKRLMADEMNDESFYRVENDQVVEMAKNPTKKGDWYASIGACLMKKDVLKRLVEDACADGGYDFDEDILMPAVRDLKVVGLLHEGYVGRVISVQSYFDVNQDMLDKSIRRDLFNPEYPVYTKIMDAPPTLFERGCEAEHSLFGNGCTVHGRVKNSIVFRGVQIAPGADVENCIIMQNSRIESGAKLRNMIIDKEVVVGEGVRCISAPYDPRIIRKRTYVEKDL